MKLKEKNEFMQQLVEMTLRDLSKAYSDKTGQEYIFEFWHNMRAKDRDGNQCFSGVIDVRRMQLNGKVDSFKRIYDRMVVQRPNIAKNEDGTPNVDAPKYGKQADYEQARYVILKEIITKSLSGFSLGMALQSKEEIEEFNRINEIPMTSEEAHNLEANATV